MRESHARFKSAAAISDSIMLATGTSELNAPIWNEVRHVGLKRTPSEDPVPARCGRFVMDGFVTTDEKDRLVAVLSRAFGANFIPSFNGDASFASQPTLTMY